ncbi:hypothetical protein [Citrobacter arsenatis]|uniref:hypothetical protein n=1 Tax=Citrobacter arsenatis TaxID=2546350 RepID=UPI00300E33C5
MQGDKTTEVSSQLLVALWTTVETKMSVCLPGGQRYDDSLVLLRVYLGWIFCGTNYVTQQNSKSTG